MGRTVVVSNRAPDPSAFEEQAGGLAVAIGDHLSRQGGLWFGWSGSLSEVEPTQVHCLARNNITYARLDLPAADFSGYYTGYANGVLWPVLHQLGALQHFHRADLEAYCRVNAHFARYLVPLIKSDDLIWIHDFHLLALPGELRQRGLRNPIGFFLHVPFAPASAMAQAPGFAKLLAGILAADLIGFQTYSDREHFLTTAELLIGAVRVGAAALRYRGHVTRLGVYPAEIDPLPWAETAKAAAQGDSARRLQRSISTDSLIIGVDRLDPTKGLLERVAAFRHLLLQEKRWQEEATYLQIAPPSRKDVPIYRELRHSLDQAVGALNSEFGRTDWTPIRLVARTVNRKTVAGLMRLARVGFVAPLRDGMNLVAKEYIAAQDPENPGVLVLSQFAGAAHQLDDALLVNPYDTEEMGETLHCALSMGLEERRRRWELLWHSVSSNSASAWGNRFLADLMAQETLIVSLPASSRLPLPNGKTSPNRKTPPKADPPHAATRL